MFLDVLIIAGSLCIVGLSIIAFFLNRQNKILFMLYDIEKSFKNAKSFIKTNPTNQRKKMWDEYDNMKLEFRLIRFDDILYSKKRIKLENFYSKEFITYIKRFK